MKRLAILGSTGSIGRSALAVVDAHPTRLSVVGLAAGRRADDLAAQIARYRPSIAALTSDDDLPALREAASKAATITTSGPDGLVAVATHPDVDIVLCASSGTARSRPCSRRSRPARASRSPTRKSS
jgi:1-deoxy-D-xylulose-5-phosphate reductoisomerase